ncbi:MAG TPA: hypothetical protein PKI32_02065 [Opitutales bacterium]|nr:hypothetical protein [Opitutales bacterium]
MNLITALFNAVGGLFAYLARRTADNNAADVRKAAAAAAARRVRDEASAKVGEGDLSSVRKYVSE